MDERTELYRKKLMDYLHNEFRNALYGLGLIAAGAVGLMLSIWVLKSLFSGYRGRMSLIVFVLPLITGGMILIGAFMVLSLPFGLAKKSKA